MRAGHKLDSFLLNALVVLWAMHQRPHLAPGSSPALLGCDHGHVLVSIPLALAAVETITCLVYSHA